MVEGVHHRPRRRPWAPAGDARSGQGACQGRYARDPALTAPDAERHPEGLRAAGWEQGCRLRITIPLTRIRLVAGKPVQKTDDHDEWVLVAQDCDLAWNSVAGSDSLVELRPVYRDDPPEIWGIRNSKFRLDEEGAYLVDSEPPVRVEPDVVFAAEHACAGPHTKPARRLKTWLALRCNRPAVPQEYVPLARELAKRLKKKTHKQAEERVRDILATFAIAEDSTVEFTLTAVIPHEQADADPELVDTTRDWLSQIALSVPDRLGLSTDVIAVTDKQLSLAFLETSYSLDVTAVSWPNSEAGPVGAVGP